MTGTLPTITAPELLERLKSGEPFALLDVREAIERAICAIRVPDHVVAIHIPMNSIPARLEDLRESTHDLPTVVYCHHGVRSKIALEWLRTRGIANLSNLEGGIDAWSLHADPATPRY